MLKKEKRWRINNVSEEKTNALLNALKIHPALCNILVQRGIDTFEKAKDFFRPELSQLHSPWLMKDMEKAVNRILNAFEAGEKILVFGDYDVDGTTSVACMYQFIKNQYNHVSFYLPHRYREGYGISKAGIHHAAETGCTLVIALDCGIKSVDLIRYAKDLGIDFIVCDHHLPDEELPPAVAILNPKQKDCPYPYKELCGCGVGFKLICAIAEKLNIPFSEPYKYVDLVATAIAADIVAITGENRVLGYYGLKKANKFPNPGIKALCILSKLHKSLQIQNLVFIIAPRVNAAGRMDEAGKAVQLFISETVEEALKWAELLHTDNDNRKEADASITEEALAIINADDVMIARNSTVLYQPHWHKGVVGIVASRLIDHYYRPTIVLTQSGDYVAGSARSVSGFNVYEAIHQCKDLLLGYGGHFYAAGITLLPHNVTAFCQRFEEIVSASIPPELLIPEIAIDAEINFKDITPSLYRILNQMEPYGPGNMCPTFITRGVTDNGFSKIVKEKHIRFVLRHQGITCSGIGFDMADKFNLLHAAQPVDIVYKIDENDYNDQKSLQLKVIDIRVSEG